jgi:hypothetical protein
MEIAFWATADNGDSKIGKNMLQNNKLNRKSQYQENFIKS